MLATLAEAETYLLQEVRNFAALIASGPTSSWRYPSFHCLLLEHGRLFTPSPLPDDVDPMPAGTCYDSSLDVADGTDRIYVEGLGLNSPDFPLSTEHAWCADPGGSLAIDPTWDPTGAAYLGLPLTPEFHVWLLDPAANRTNKALFGRHWYQIFQTGLPTDALVPNVGRPVTDL